MRIVVIAIGKIKERGIREAVDDYFSRARRYVPVDEIELRDASPAKIVETAERAVPTAAHRVALDPTGRAPTSEGFARWIETAGRRDKGVIAFFIGGAEGLPAELLARAHEKISLSAMTFPHRLARLMLAEQIYRAMTILRGEPYAK